MSIDFVTIFPISAGWKDNSYNLIQVIVNKLAKMVHYKLVKVTIDALSQAKVIIDMVVCHHGVLESIVTNWGLLFISKFWSLLCYFLRIKKMLFTTFNSQINGQIKRQNSMMEAYLAAFVNWEQDDWVKLLPIVEFAYNNIKNTSTGHTLFEFNCGYHSKVFFKEDVNPCSKSRFINKLAEELKKLIEICCQNLFYV